jgi:hypothetical protein
VLISVLGFYIRWRPKRFAGGTIGIGIAKLGVKDLSTSSLQTHDEYLISVEEVEPIVRNAFAPSRIDMKLAERAFISHNDARAWGVKTGASIVIWGTAERGSQGIIVHLKATRIQLPETAHQTEIYKRFFLQKPFPEYFRDAETYVTDFDLGTLPVNLTNPEQMSAVKQEAALLTSFVGGVLADAAGEYQASPASATAPAVGPVSAASASRLNTPPPEPTCAS